MTGRNHPGFPAEVPEGDDLFGGLLDDQVGATGPHGRPRSAGGSRRGRGRGVRGTTAAGTPHEGAGTDGGGVDRDPGGLGVERVEGGAFFETEWESFRLALELYLFDIAEPADGNRLWIDVPGPGADPPVHVLLSTFDAGRMIRAEVPPVPGLVTHGERDGTSMSAMAWREVDADGEQGGWRLEVPATDAISLAGRVVWALRGDLGVPHPHLLTYRASGPAVDAAARLGLSPTDAVPLERGIPPVDAAIRGSDAALPEVCLPGDRDEFFEQVEAVLRRRLGEEPTVDQDGDLVLEHLGQPVWVRVLPNQPAVEILARVAHDVYSRRAAAVEIGLLNRDHAWVKWTLHDRAVSQSILVPGLPFVPAHLDGMLTVFLAAMAATRDDLAYRIRAKVG